MVMVEIVDMGDQEVDFIVMDVMVVILVVLLGYHLLMAE